MLPRRKAAAYTLALALIAIGLLGIIFSPSAGLASAREWRSFSREDVSEESWGNRVVISEFQLPWIQNSRGLYFMHALVGASIITIFCGVHILTATRHRAP